MVNFSVALDAVKSGKKIARTGWNGKGMWVAYCKGYPDGVLANKNAQECYGVSPETVIKVLPHLSLKTADNCFVPWIISQTDALAEDWIISGEDA